MISEGDEEPGSGGPASETWPGLCGRCRHARIVESHRGSRFWLCRRSETDAEYPRYPRLPVLECAGFEAGSPTEGSGSGRQDPR